MKRFMEACGGWASVLALAFMILIVPRTMEAQGPGPTLSMIQERGLHFGHLMPGVPELVSISDVSRRAAVVIRGTGVVQVQLVLPEYMLSAEGAPLPLEFDETHAGFQPGVAVRLRRFDPRQPVLMNLPLAGEALLFLGATAMPAVNQPAGAYSATIVVLISRTDS